MSLSALQNKSEKMTCDDPETSNSELSKTQRVFFMPSKKSIKSCISEKIPNKTRNEGNNIKIQNFSSNVSSYQNLHYFTEENAKPIFFPIQHEEKKRNGPIFNI